MTDYFRRWWVRAMITFTLATSLVPLVSVSAQAQALRLSGHHSTASQAQLDGGQIAYQSAPLSLELPAWTYRPTIHLETSLNRWRDGSDDTMTSAALTPVWQWPLGRSGSAWQLEFGIGIAVLDAEHIDDRDLGSRFQFEDRIGLHWRYDRQGHAKLGINFLHYSNADLASPNQGLDFGVLSWTIGL